MHAADGAAVAQDVHARQVAVALVGQRGDGKAQFLGGAHAVFAAKGQHRRDAYYVLLYKNKLQTDTEQHGQPAVLLLSACIQYRVFCAIMSSK